MQRFVRVIGAAQTPMDGRRTPVGDLAARAAAAALEDADLLPSQLQVVLVSNALGSSAGQEMIRGQSWLAPLRLGSLPIINVENACAGGISALHLGRRLAVDGPVLVVGAETMWHRPRPTIQAELLGGVAAETRADLGSGDLTIAPLMAHNARRAARFLDSGRGQVDDLVAVVRKARWFSHRNPIAAHREELDARAIRAAPLVEHPLTRPMCCSYTDGAAAIVLGPSGEGPLLRATNLATGDGSGDWFGRFGALAAAAWADAGIAPSDLDLIELHDVTAAEELQSLEALGLYGPGEAGPATRRGDTGLGGTTTVNPSGGLIGRGHPLAATGLAQVVEAADQLRGRASSRQVERAEVAATVNMGGIIGDEPAVVGMSVLSAR